MKKLFVIICLMAGASSSAIAQDLIGKSPKKKATKTRTSNATPAKPVDTKTYKSPNGGMVVHDIEAGEVLDSTQKSKITAPHVNSNYNETQPALAPSDGNNSR